MSEPKASEKIATALDKHAERTADAVAKSSEYEGKPRIQHYGLAVFSAILAAIGAYVVHQWTSSSDNKPEPTQSASIKGAANDVSTGKRFIEQGDFANAYDAFKRATTIDPSNSYAWANLGGAAAMLGRSSESVQAYDRALTIDPENWLAHYNLGCQLLRLGRRDEAFEHVSRAVGAARRQARSSAEREGMLNSMRRDDAMRELRNDPRFKQLFAAK